MDQNPEDVSQLRQLTLEQIRQLPPGKSVYVRFVVENANEIITHIRGYDTLVIEKQARKRKGPLIKAIRPASFPIEIDLREKYTEQSRVVIGSTEEGTFFFVIAVLYGYCKCSVKKEKVNHCLLLRPSRGMSFNAESWSGKKNSTMRLR